MAKWYYVQHGDEWRAYETQEDALEALRVKLDIENLYPMSNWKPLSGGLSILQFMYNPFKVPVTGWGAMSEYFCYEGTESSVGIQLIRKHKIEEQVSQLKHELEALTSRVGDLLEDAQDINARALQLKELLESDDSDSH